MKKFKNLSDKKKLAIIDALANGQTVEVHLRRDLWMVVHDICVNDRYRIKPIEPTETPEPIAEFPWDSINPKYKWFAFDADGRMFLYLVEPIMGCNAWHSDAGFSTVGLILPIIPPQTCEWGDSLQQRPTTTKPNGA